MQNCNCANAWRFVPKLEDGSDGLPQCVVCGAAWGEGPSAVGVENRAKELYANHLNLSSKQVVYMWKQCSLAYREAWRTIARIDLE
jgi:hypothetical protein